MLKEDIPKVRVQTKQGIAECYDIQPRLFSTYLIDDLNITWKAACRISKAVNELHKALCYCDSVNRRKFFNEFNNVESLLNNFGINEELTDDF